MGFDSDAKLIYDVSKLTNQTKQILDGFNMGISIFLLGEYLKTIDENIRLDTLNSILYDCGEALMIDKMSEIETLISNTDSMSNMAIGSSLAASENIEEFKKCIVSVKNLIIQTMSNVSPKK